VNILGVIPARGGSKGLPGKNLAVVAGRPLLAWTADAARASRTLTRIVLSTDDETIAREGQALGLDVPFLRDPSLAGDETPIVPVLRDLLTRLHAASYAADIVVLLQPTSPLRRAEHIDAGVTRLIETGADVVVSVVEVPHQFHPLSVMAESHGRLTPWTTGHVTRRQEKPTLYARNGPAVLVLRPAILNSASLYEGDTRALVMSPADSVDVDTAWDLELAGLLLEQRR
jgi:CMP-N-acetylneuraminic acid synthetase